LLDDKTLEGITFNSPSEYPHIKVGKRPVAIDVLSDVAGGIHTVYVVNSKDNTVSVIDGIDNTNTRNDINVGAFPMDINIEPFTDTIYVANYGDNSLSLINGINSRVVAQVKFKTEPFNAGYIECDKEKK
jgi:YVTN family beta-propeller protein